MAETLDTQNAWSGTRVDAERIETALGRLRYEAAGMPPEGESFAIRTSFANLVVYANDEENGRHASQLIAGLSGQHPSRTIIIVARPDEPDSRIDTQLAAHCHIAPGLDQKVCCEEITLKVVGPAAKHLHSVLAPLLIPDLPNYVWWIGGLPHDHHLFGDMMDNADRFIVDSGRFTRTALDLPQLEHLSSRAGHCALGDLNWQRLLPWRQVVAREFTAPTLAPYVRHVTAIKLSFARHEQDEWWSQPLLMSGWLSLYFGLDLSSVKVQAPGAVIVQQANGNVAFRMIPTEFPNVVPGDLVSVEIRCEAPTANNASLAISRKADPLHLDITIDEPSGSILTHVRIDAGDERAMLDRELNSLTHDPEYRNALRATLPFVPAAD